MKMRDQQIQIDVKRCALESYAQMKARQQREVNGFPKVFALPRGCASWGLTRLTGTRSFPLAAAVSSEKRMRTTSRPCAKGTA